MRTLGIWFRENLPYLMFLVLVIVVVLAVLSVTAPQTGYHGGKITNGLMGT